MIAYDRLQQIIPADQALANKALSVSLAQITNVGAMTLPALARAVGNIETTRDLPIISSLSTAVPPNVAAYYNTLAIGSGVNGTVQTTDVIGLASGWVATSAFGNTVAIFNTMNMTELTTVYQTMSNAASGNYGLIDSGPLTIPSGLPCAGTYYGNFYSEEVPNPHPPPANITIEGYNPSALDLAMTCLVGSAGTAIANLETNYPTECAQLNTLWNSMANQVVSENNLQNTIHLNYANLQAHSTTAIYSFIYSLPQYGTQTEVGGLAQMLENMADLTIQGGQAVVATLRQGRNAAALSATGIPNNLTIPVDPAVPPPQASLIPSTYTQAEAANIIIP
jgi:hypothetical protein